MGHFIVSFQRWCFAAFEWQNTTSGYWNVAANWLNDVTQVNMVPDGTAEIKIRKGGETILNSYEDNNTQRMRLYNGSMTITDGAELIIGWTRIGYTGNQLATINQDGVCLITVTADWNWAVRSEGVSGTSAVEPLIRMPPGCIWDIPVRAAEDTLRAG